MDDLLEDSNHLQAAICKEAVETYAIWVSRRQASQLCITYTHCGTYRPPVYIPFCLFAFCSAAKGRHLGELLLQSQSRQPKSQGKPSVLTETI